MALRPPVNGTEVYLAAIHDRLGEILDRLPERTEEPGQGEVELREPAPPTTGRDRPAELAEPAPQPSRRRTRKTGGA